MINAKCTYNTQLTRIHIQKKIPKKRRNKIRKRNYAYIGKNILPFTKMIYQKYVPESLIISPLVCLQSRFDVLIVRFTSKICSINV